MDFVLSEHLIPPSDLTPFVSARLDTLLYFYSTLPQVLGAIVALTGAFAVFKMNGYKSDLNARTQIIVEILSQDDLRLLLDPLFPHGEIKAIYGDFQIQQKALNRKDIVALSIRFSSDLRERLKMPTKGSSKIDHRRHGLILNLLHYCAIIISLGYQIRVFLRRTTITFIVGGTIITVLLTLFMFIPYIALNIESYWWYLGSGLFITIVALGWIIVYIINSLRDKRFFSNRDLKMIYRMKISGIKKKLKKIGEFITPKKQK